MAGSFFATDEARKMTEQAVFVTFPSAFAMIMPTNQQKGGKSMENRRPETMERITTKALADAFIKQNYRENFLNFDETADYLEQLRENFGKNSEKPDKSQDVSKEFVDFYLGSSGYMKEGFQQNVRSQNIGASKKLEVTDAVQGITRESSVFEEKIFTRDGFAKLEDAEFEFIKEENENARLKGEGKVKFLKIPYNLVMKDDTTVKGEAYGKDAVEKVKFNIIRNGFV